MQGIIKVRFPSGNDWFTKMNIDRFYTHHVRRSNIIKKDGDIISALYDVGLIMLDNELAGKDDFVYQINIFNEDGTEFSLVAEKGNIFVLGDRGQTVDRY